MENRVIDRNFYDYSELTSEMKYEYSRVFKAFQVSHHGVVDAKGKVNSLLDFYRQTSVQNVIQEKLTSEEWSANIDGMKLCKDALDEDLQFIKSELEKFQNLAKLTTGTMNMFYEIADTVIELFDSVQKETEKRMRKIQEISEMIKNLTQTEED